MKDYLIKKNKPLFDEHKLWMYNYMRQMRERMEEPKQTHNISGGSDVYGLLCKNGNEERKKETKEK